jgi:calcyphosin
MRLFLSYICCANRASLSPGALVDKYEFSKALAEMGLVVNKLEFEELMRHYDADGDGTISFDEFLYAVRGELSPAREQLVEKAFQKLDIDNNGVLTLADIREVYDASGHPEVLSGKKTEEEILEDFLYSMEGAAVIPDNAMENRRDGQVTMKEFKEYYAFVGASIDTDDEFALMMNNAWKFNA